MKTRIFAIVFLAAVFIDAAGAQAPGRTQWIGVWESKLDGQTGAVLTLGDDTGRPGGTLVLNMIMNDGGRPHVACSEPHVLINPRMEGNALFFSVKRDKGPEARSNFTVTLAPGGRVRMHCTNCGKNAPIADMERVW